MVRFCRYQLRTTQVDTARAFYGALVDGGLLAHQERAQGLEPSARPLVGAGAALEIVELPPELAARGVPAHWLGQVGVDDVEATASAFVERGATRLGPSRGGVAIVRDAGGAVLALGPRVEPPALVGWHVLNTPGAARACETYAAVFGWRFSGSAGLFELSWREGEPAAGAVVDVAGRSGVHPHWLHFFVVPSLARALEAVRAAGGVVTAQLEALRLAVCDDPQGAAFGLREAR